MLAWPLLDAVAAPDAGCALHWQVQVGPATGPRQLQVTMAFDAGPRNRSTLRLPGGWDTMIEDRTAPANAPRLQAVPGAPLLRSVAHAPGERVQLQWHYTPAVDAAQQGGARLAATWLAFSGLALLPVPDEIDERQPPEACVTLGGLADGDAGQRWVSSHGSAEGGSTLLRIRAGAAPLRVRVQQALYAGGALRVQQQVVDGSAVIAAMPADTAWRFTPDALAAAGAQALAAQRRFWGDAESPGAWLLLLLPGLADNSSTDSGSADSPASRGASAWQQALALQAPADLALPSPAFDSLIAQALARAWVADRFGPLAHAGRGDEALRAWFSEGWANFLAHRSLLRNGQWTAQDYANAINRRIELALDPAAAGPDRSAEQAAAQGEWLALQWHAALREQGQPGLEAVLRRLLLPPAQARREGPISAPLATHRLLAALRAPLGDAPLRDITRLVDGQQRPALGPASDPAFGPSLLGPCFVGQRDTPPPPLPRYQPVPQALQQTACQGWLGLGPEALRAAAIRATGDRSTIKGKTAAAGKAASKHAKKRSGKQSGKAVAKPSRKTAAAARRR